MNKSELVKAIAEKAELNQKDALAAVNAFIEVVSKTMKDEPVQLVGFGTFTVGERSARTGVNPATGAKIEIKAAKAPKFKPGKALKDAIN